MRSIEIYQQNQESDLNNLPPFFAGEYIPRPVRLESSVKSGVNISVGEKIPTLDLDKSAK